MLRCTNSGLDFAVISKFCVFSIIYVVCSKNPICLTFTFNSEVRKILKVSEKQILKNNILLGPSHCFDMLRYIRKCARLCGPWLCTLYFTLVSKLLSLLPNTCEPFTKLHLFIWYVYKGKKLKPPGPSISFLKLTQNIIYFFVHKLVKPF